MTVLAMTAWRKDAIQSRHLRRVESTHFILDLCGLVERYLSISEDHLEWRPLLLSMKQKTVSATHCMEPTRTHWFQLSDCMASAMYRFLLQYIRLSRRSIPNTCRICNGSCSFVCFILLHSYVFTMTCRIVSLVAEMLCDIFYRLSRASLYNYWRLWWHIPFTGLYDFTISTHSSLVSSPRHF